MEKEIQKNIIDLYSSYTPVNEISKAYNVSDHSIYKLLRKHKLSRKSGETTAQKTLFSFEKMTKQKAFLLGVIYGDGHVNIKQSQIQISMSDKDVLDKINLLFDNKYNIKPYKSCYRLTICSKKIVTELVNTYKLCSNKSDKLIFPNIGDEFLPAFISGYIASDGCIFYKNKILSLSFTSCSYDFLISLQEKIISNTNIPKRNYTHLIKKKIDNTSTLLNYNCNNIKPIYYLLISCKNSYNVCKYIFNNLGENEVCLRKYLKYKESVEVYEKLIELNNNRLDCKKCNIKLQSRGKYKNTNIYRCPNCKQYIRIKPNNISTKNPANTYQACPHLL